MILYFSATGNSQFVAKSLAEATGDRAVSMLTITNGEITLKDGECLGIVTPTYCWGLPSVVDDFFNSVHISGGEKSYIYYVATYGTTTGQTGRFM